VQPGQTVESKYGYRNERGRGLDILAYLLEIAVPEGHYPRAPTVTMTSECRNSPGNRAIFASDFDVRGQNDVRFSQYVTCPLQPLPPLFATVRVAGLRWVRAMMAYVISDGRLLALRPSEWSTLLVGVALCGIAVLLF